MCAVAAKVAPKIHPAALQNPPAWHSKSKKSTKLGSKIHQVGLQNQEKSVLGCLWSRLGAILRPRGTQDQNIPPKPKVLPPSWAPILEVKNLPKLIFEGSKRC